MNKYLKILRLDHWIKQMFIVPGAIFAYVVCSKFGYFDDSFGVLNSISNFSIALLSTCSIASANYAINEWLDAEFDKYHPVKKNRSIVKCGADGRIVCGLYILLGIVGLCLAAFVSKQVFYSELILLLMGIVYNVKPVRAKDIPYIDVLSESFNNALRLLIGWFSITPNFWPPSSLIIGYWLLGAFLMATKRFSEYKMIGNPVLASMYRKSFKYYSEKSLIISAFFYAISSNFFVGIFLIKYRIELILFVPAFMGMFCYYFLVAFKKNSAAQEPEKLFRERGLMCYLLCLILLFILLMLVDMPGLDLLVDNKLVSI